MRMADRSHLRLHVGCPSSPQLPEEENSPHRKQRRQKEHSDSQQDTEHAENYGGGCQRRLSIDVAADSQVHAIVARLQSCVEMFRKLGDLSVGGVESERLRGYCAALVGVREDTQSVAAASARARHQWRLTGYVIS